MKPVMFTVWFSYAYGALMIVFLIIYIATSLLLSSKRVALKKGLFSLRTFVGFNLIVGLLMWFFTYENIYFFSARFWFLVILIIDILLIRNVYKSFGRVLVKSEAQKREEVYQKYIPR